MVDLTQEIVDLTLGGPDRDRGVDQARGPDDLFDDLFAVLLLVRTWGCRDEDCIFHHALELGERERPVVAC